MERCPPVRKIDGGRFPVRYTTRIIVPPRVRRSGLPGAPSAGPRPQAIGVRKSLGYGDPLGLAAAAHVAIASDHPDFAPFFAQHSTPTAAGLSPQETLALACRAIGSARFRQPWGADADLLRTPQEVDAAAVAGYPYFTIDLSEHVRGDADELSPDALVAAVDTMVANGELPDDWLSPYLSRTVDLPGSGQLRLDLPNLRLAAVKFWCAIQHGARMYETVARASRGRPYEIEISLDRAGSPVGPVEHLYLGLELEARGVRLTSLALRLDDREAGSFEAALREHAAIASFCGPYKLSFRSGTHDPALLPVIGRCCGEALHYKTSAETVGEALRLACRLEPDLFRRILSLDDLLPNAEDDAEEARYFDGGDDARTLEQVSATLLVTGPDQPAHPLKAALLELLEQRMDIFQELLAVRFNRLFQQLNAG